MNCPKFEVGEEVILVSTECPEFNGDYFVEKIIFHGEVYKDRITGFNMIACWYPASEIGYLLSGKEVDSRGGLEIVWAESALRKKHKPAEMSFSALMQSLTIPVGVQ